MFDQIAPTYDRINRLMTFGLDRLWRKRLARFLPQKPHLHLLDGATGTGDQIIALLSHKKSFARIVGIDLSKEMLALARKKCPAANVSFQEASLLELPFEEQSFDCVTLAFGIRNVTDVARALSECHRVLSSGGRLLILEGSLPQYRLIRSLYLLHLRVVLPWLGARVSKHKGAYRYLNQTIETFPCGAAFCALLKEAGFVTATAHPMTLGSVTLYVGEKA
jgi:demethylmenaquinone methyltransferase/2-methoxy-6-polyprenyl-1,4-benzoquinol methylase